MEHVGLPRRDKPCERCGWRYVGWHVCFDASKPCPEEGKLDPGPKKGKKKSADNRSAVASATATRRWEEYRQHFKERDADIVVDYKEGIGLRDLADKYGISHTTVIKIIRRAEAETGETIMRPKGYNKRWGGKKEADVSGGFQ